MLLAKIFFKFHALVQKCHFGEIEKLPGIETKNSNICVKQMFFTIFVKKFFFRNYKKKRKMNLPDESRDQIGLITPRAGSCIPPPPSASNRVKVIKTENKKFIFQ